MPSTSRVSVTRVPGGTTEDLLVVEEPLEIRIGDKPLSVTMRTPGDDFDLAAGFLLTESIIRDREDIASIRHWGSPNVVRVSLRDGLSIDLQKLQRHFYATSSCGVCGKTSIEALRMNLTAIESDARVSATLLATLPDALRGAQQTFAATGGIHGAAAFTSEGALLRVREDVGRHNAVDKVIGSLFRDGTHAEVLVVSSRAGFEIVQKCVAARIPILATVGAPSSLAVELAREFGVTLAGFVRDGRFNLYAREERIGA
jgi:FdhD protein